MNKQAKIAVIAVFLIFMILLLSFVVAAPRARRARKACRDGSDNDGDGYIDWPSDPGCANKNDNSELNPAIECDDGVDNDGDNATDMADNGCSGPTDDDETNCGDGVCEGGETHVSCPADCEVPDSCSETDGGREPYVFGTTSGYLNGSYYSDDDYCVDSSTLMEYYCFGDYEYNSQESCGTDTYSSNYCSGGDVYRDFIDYFCSTGACGNSSTPELVEECDYGCTAGECDPIPDSCLDTDFGFVPEIQGTVSGYLDEQNYSNTDFCISNITLKEYYCSGNHAYSSDVPCTLNVSSGCLNGACV